MIKLNAFFLVACLFFSGCAVKARPPALQDNSTGQSGLPPGVASGAKQKLLVRASPDTLVAGEENTVTFQVVGTDLVPVDLAVWAPVVKYRMPSMPGMGVFSTPVKILGPGRFEAVLDIVHGKDWRIEVTFQKEGTPVDDVVIDYYVKE